LKKLSSFLSAFMSELDEAAMGEQETQHADTSSTTGAISLDDDAPDQIRPPSSAEQEMLKLMPPETTVLIVRIQEDLLSLGSRPELRGLLTHNYNSGHVNARPIPFTAALFFLGFIVRLSELGYRVWFVSEEPTGELMSFLPHAIMLTCGVSKLPENITFCGYESLNYGRIELMGHRFIPFSYVYAGMRGGQFVRPQRIRKGWWRHPDEKTWSKLKRRLQRHMITFDNEVEL
jgi:hypothetical protein